MGAVAEILEVVERYESDDGFGEMLGNCVWLAEYSYNCGGDDKAAAGVASINGVSPGGWLQYAQQMEQAGADAIELNIYRVSTEMDLCSADLEAEDIQIVSELVKALRIPLAVKLSPYYTSLPNFAAALDEAGAAAIILFNRFYQPNVDIEELELCRDLQLSTSAELNMRLRWLAILSGRIRAQLAVTGGIHTAVDALRGIMCGADVCQVVSCLLRHGPEHLKTLRKDIVQWLEEHEYESLNQARASMSLQKCPDPASYVRANYMQVLRSWDVQ